MFVCGYLTRLSRSNKYESSSRWSASQSEMISPIYLGEKVIEHMFEIKDCLWFMTSHNKTAQQGILTRKHMFPWE